MKGNVLLKTNLLVCVIVISGFLLIGGISYKTNYSAETQSLEQVSTLTLEGLYHQITEVFTAPVHVSVAMSHDSLLKELLLSEAGGIGNQSYNESITDYLGGYKKQYGYDSVFLVSSESRRYYTCNGFNHMVQEGLQRDAWYYNLMELPDSYELIVDEDSVTRGVMMLFVNCRVIDDSGKTLGVVGVGMRISNLQQMIKQYEQSFDVDAYLINDSGSIQISSIYTGFDNVNLFDVNGYEPHVKDEILSWREDGITQTLWTKKAGTADRARNFMATRYIKELDWHLVVEQDTGDVVKRIKDQAMYALIIIAVVSIVLLAVISYVIRGFKSRIESIVQKNEYERRTVFEMATSQLFENVNEIDITNDRAANRSTEKYFKSLGFRDGEPYSEFLRKTAEKEIAEEHRQGYIDTFAPERVLEAVERGLESLQYEARVLNADGGCKWVRILARIVRMPHDGSVHMIVYRQNIDAEKHREQQIRELALVDEATGLLTKTAARRRIEVCLAQSPQQYAFFMVDIDDFKQANDAHSHVFGDSVIAQTASIIRSSFRNGDIVGRMGGDEFGVFIPITDEQWVRKKARELSAALHRTHSFDGESWEMSVSIGVSLSPRDGMTFEQLYKNADSALYYTKNNGKNGYKLYDGRP